MVSLVGKNRGYARSFNRRAVLDLVRQRGPVSRSDIAREIGLTTQTVSTITSELEESGILKTLPGLQGARGFPAPLYEIAPEGGYAIGISVSPRGLKAGLMDLSGRFTDHRELEARQIEPERAFDWAGQVISELSSSHGDDQILGVGLSLPGPFGIESMSFVGPTSLEGWTIEDVDQGIQNLPDFPIFVDGDMSAAAHAERLFGRGVEVQNFFYLFVGAGLGGAMISDSRVNRGSYGNASEIGHIPLVMNGEYCPCGNRGCLERYISLEAYDRRVSEVGEARWLEEIRPIFHAAIVTIENLYEPETIVVGGVLAPDLKGKIMSLTDDLPNSLGARADRQVPRVIPSQLGSDIAIRGAASLALNRIFAPEDTIPDQHGKQVQPDIKVNRLGSG